ncbi:hypothetical protein [Lactococcus kimchii]|uniref:hypothetical protein n=1 Tax=Lactococcus sp. S-13 TaxID=2507158 RepID=UPI001023A2A4|nr:hypothetical protein [Lactococcus sp. S-13]RZI48003.1 hypothetical protein EQJ87_00230 [Lactococcus sp. S-13]RZI48438.1 hypothetical protein EQJ87_02660 [Lactococcus sp. S-13]RZI49835.1 hypothetical protein EQJ87_10580 [Lactococcus sp. S-13]
MKQYWVIENHLDGGIYLMPEDTPGEELEEAEDTCDICGDNDLIIGQFSNWQQLKKRMTDDENYCPYSDEYLQSVFEEDNQ